MVCYMGFKNCMNPISLQSYLCPVVNFKMRDMGLCSTCCFRVSIKGGHVIFACITAD